MLEREFFIDNLLVRIHCIIVMIRWTGLAPWELMLTKTGADAPGNDRGGDHFRHHYWRPRTSSEAPFRHSEAA